MKDDRQRDGQSAEQKQWREEVHVGQRRFRPAERTVSSNPMGRPAQAIKTARTSGQRWTPKLIIEPFGRAVHRLHDVGGPFESIELSRQIL
jgi:hypothetical protein